MKNSILAIIALSAVTAQGASLVNVANTVVSNNNANYDLSVFAGQAAYNDGGFGGTQPSAPTFRNTLGDGTLLSYNLVGNAGTGSVLTSYASSGTRTPVPVADNSGPTTTHGNGEDWSNVWITTDPGAGTVFTGTRMPTPLECPVQPTPLRGLLPLMGPSTFLAWLLGRSTFRSARTTTDSL